MFLLFSSPLKQQPTKIFGKKNNLFILFYLMRIALSMLLTDSRKKAAKGASTKCKFHKKVV